MCSEIFFTKKEDEYKELMEKINQCFLLNEKLPNKVFKKPYNKFLCEESDLIRYDRFWENVKTLSNLSNDNNVIFGVLNPSPKSYYYHYFGYYSIAKLSVDIKNEEFSNLIEYAPENNEADSIFFNSNIIICIPLSKKWAIYADRDFEICILAFDEAYEEELKSLLPRWLPIKETIDTYMYSLFMVMPEFLEYFNMSKEQIKDKFIQNYGDL